QNSILVKMSSDGERTFEIPLILPAGSVRLTRRPHRSDYFQVFCPGAEITKTVQRGFEVAKRRVFVEQPIATLLFSSKIYSPRDERGKLKAERTLVQIEKV